MSYDCPDFVQDATMLLEAAGYSFHERDEDGETFHWFCWSQDGMDIESGEDCPDPLQATASALKHWFDSARILSCEQEDILDRLNAGQSFEVHNGEPR